MLANELRQKYLDFFLERGHLHLPSAPLIPVDALGNPDPTTLFTGSGMQQFKPFFTGAAAPPSTRVTTVQKCVRTGDIDSVGDFSHCTFFEMLGNFSFGDYFKADVIPWTWEFLTKVVGLDPDRFCVTVFLDDDEAFRVWNEVVGLPEDRIHRMGEDKNYWPASAISQGPDGPCGPCSEVFYRVAPLEEMTTDPNLTPTERYKIDDDAGRWLEVWNNVFTQFDRSEDETGKPVLTPLPKKNNDTGAGFDRIVQVHQGKRSVFETDLFEPILRQITELSEVEYTGTNGPKDFALRVVAEHSRTIAFCIADGILPSNEGAGYVLRYIMRRAMRYGKSVLGLNDPFLYKVAPVVIEQMGGFYTELRERRELITQTIKGEEERFLRTLENGSARLTELLNSTTVMQSKTLSGSDAFLLYDTFGFPYDLTRDIAAEHGYTVDRAGFEQAMAEQKERSRESSEMGKELFTNVGAAIGELLRTEKPTEFLGYEQLVSDAKIVAIIKGGELVETARPGDGVEIVLDRTPFYAESGGQVGDVGTIIGLPGSTTCTLKIEVLDTRKSGGIFLHTATVLEGEASVGQRVFASVDGERRRHVMRNHTATHLLQAALRQVLGSHVHQKGSLVGPEGLRFDFTHTQPMSADELAQVEEIVNERILEDAEVHVYQDLPLAEARARGAMALFGEKYGDRVRMVQVTDFSLELCGGTHLSRTSQAGLFKIVSETGTGAGVRRIEAVTGRAAIDFVNSVEKKLEQVASVLKSNPRDVLIAAEKVAKERAELQKQVQQLKSGAVASGELETVEVDGIKVATGVVAGADKESLAALADRTANKLGSAVVAVAAEADGAALFVVKVTPDLVKRGFHAGNMVREIAKVAGGGGGGRPDFAQAGGKDISQIGAALAKAEELVRAQGSSG